MMNSETATNVVAMIENEVNGEYAYTSFEGMCREYGITPQDFQQFLQLGLDTVKLLETNRISQQELKILVENNKRPTA